MARETRDADVIGKTGVYLYDACDKLTTLKTNFVNHINSMSKNYQGVDALSIANELNSAINKIDGLVKNLNYYSEYMLALSKYDNKNIKNIQEQINMRNNKQIDNYMEGEFFNEFRQPNNQ